jgi:hypothetical protein
MLLLVRTKNGLRGCGRIREVVQSAGTCVLISFACWMDFVHVSVRGCLGTVGVDVDGTAHPGDLAVHVLLYVEVHGAWM